MAGHSSGGGHPYSGIPRLRFAVQALLLVSKVRIDQTSHPLLKSWEGDWENVNAQLVPAVLFYLKIKCA